ncbi:hypothetical protein BH20VER2_BH20VER2_18640 [soil metagenome]
MMRLSWRHLRPGELDHELIWLLVSGAAGLLGAAWLALRLPWPRCTFLAVTGLPCLTCGATRSAAAFLQGDLALAWQWNPLVFLGICAVVLFDVYALLVLLTWAPRLRVSLTHPRAGRAVAGTLIVLALLNWGYVLLRS